MRQQYGLSPNMSRLLGFIQAYQQDEGICPTFNEMMQHMGYRSKSPVHRIVEALEDRGHIVRIPNCARSIRVVADNTITIQFPVGMEEALRIRADALGVSVESLIVKYCRDAIYGRAKVYGA